MKENILEVLKEWNIENADLHKAFGVCEDAVKLLEFVDDNLERIRSVLKDFDEQLILGGFRV